MAVGRPTKRSPEVEAKILEWIAAGATAEDAAEAAGIHRSQFYRWREQFRDFRDKVAHAEAECAASYAEVLRDASIGIVTGEKITVTETVFRKRKTTTGSGPDRMVVEEDVPVEVTRTTVVERTDRDWRAAESWLKRRRQKDWGDKQTTEVSGAGGGPVPISIIEPIIPSRGE